MEVERSPVVSQIYEDLKRHGGERETMGSEATTVV
jgi:hypothetical protein